ncbi:helix-turn-helix domain-containing protein [Amycolatopsis minnesotensis]|uniref:Helix-turn-helix domain-containing protein n=1 Tax=Amycolatopsis minnesotensis TaxID=337894 RepID=A0ABN2RF28_9PSEU
MTTFFPPGTAPTEDAERACHQVLKVLQRIGDKWSLVLIGRLRHRTMRFGELHREITGISQRMLTLTLRQLERDGLVRRTVHATVPPKVEYALTELGVTLLEPVHALGLWAAEHRREIEDNRERYDAGAERGTR